MQMIPILVAVPVLAEPAARAETGTKTNILRVDGIDVN
jgi:hypothetical protein